MADSTQYNLSLVIKAQNEATKEIEKINWQVSSIWKIVWWLAISKTLVSWMKSFSNEVLTLWWNLEQAEIAFWTMLWSWEKAQKMLADLTDFAKKTPFELTWIRESAKQMLAMWIDADKMIPTLKSLWDVSAWLWVDLSRLAYNFWQVRSQWKLTWTELRDFTKMWVPILSELATMLWTTETEIQWMVSAWKIWFAEVEQAFANMTSEWWKFENLMERQSWTYQWMLSNLNDSFDHIKETLWRTFIPILEKVLSAITPILDKLSQRVEENPELATTIATVVAAAIAFIWALSWLSAILPLITSWITLLTWPIWLVAAAIALLATAWINDRWWIQEKTQDAVERIERIIGPRLEKLKARREKHWETVMIYVEEVMWAIADTIWTTLWLIATGISITFQTIESGIELFTAIWNWDREKVWDICMNRAIEIDKILTESFWETRESIKKWIQQFYDRVIEKFNALKDAVMSVVNAIKDAWNSAKNFVWDIWTWISNAASSTRDFVSSPFRAWWWDVYSWQSYIVWEKWPELFVPNQKWSVVPTNQITNNNWIEININGAVVRNDNDIQAIADEITRRIKLEKNFWIA